MINHNTTQSEDNVIRRAKKKDIISDLLDIINRLDNEIERWKNATLCSNPDEYTQRNHNER